MPCRRRLPGKASTAARRWVVESASHTLDLFTTYTPIHALALSISARLTLRFASLARSLCITPSPISLALVNIGGKVSLNFPSLAPRRLRGYRFTPSPRRTFCSSSPPARSSSPPPPAPRRPSHFPPISSICVPLTG
ncbi:Hypothetical protein NTJ_05407 [Nesidiocoris tenuis]|uniref:Uncharacterized protein n=1 Tax=Nesidiocoris tenuis TaxID=355587 RepID=A0ABN7AKL8_9HEMI|nr:Hypothetical protein NTJ_05407 [Nesidiocoris tenuis]